MSRRSMRKELEALRAQVQQGSMQQNQNPALQGPITSGSVTSQGGFFKGDKGGIASASRFSPEIMELISELAKSGSAGLQSLTGQQFNFAPIEAQARADFAQKTIPSIAERFASLGTGGSQRSSAFPQLLSQAGSDLERQLAAMREQFGLQEKGLNANIYGNMLQYGMQPAWENMYRQGSPSGISNLLNSVVSGGSKVLGSYLGGV